MSIVLVGSSSGSITLQEPAVAGTTVLDLPATSGTLLTTASAISASSITTGTLPKAQLPAGSVLQVVSVTKTDTWSENQSANSVSGTNVTGLIPSITPTSASSKILVIVNLHLASGASLDAGHGVGFRLYRSGTAIALGDSSSSRTSVTGASLIYSETELFPNSMHFLDSPATTSSISYSIRLYQGSGGTTFMYVNRSGTDNNASSAQRSVSSITLMEIAA
jgi:hypothetical protein